jgi:hypothetical protein
VHAGREMVIESPLGEIVDVGDIVMVDLDTCLLNTTSS